jgi:hypothetical protein
MQIYYIYRVFTAQADWTFILPSELPTRAAPHAKKNAAAGLSDFSVCGAMVPRGGIFLSKWHSTFTGSSDSTMNVQSACALNTLYMAMLVH